ncbi:SafA/ExsA family spore coat assembly protein, partial [Peribacillus butanolivorans]|uniref:SafA/ExsA family spore coat assembly protein n=1 Tax=Peribacillus butanolivorans TaxID=421767 RepID=UPI0037C66F53
MKIHIVQKGDTLWKLAKKYGVSFEELKKVNAQLSNPDMMMPGMKIKIPGTSGAVKKETIIPSTNIPSGMKETQIHPAHKKEQQIMPKPPMKEQQIIPKKEQQIVQPKPIIKEKQIVVPKEVPVPIPVVPEIDINNYYMVNMTNMSVQKPPAPPPLPKKKEKAVAPKKKKPAVQEVYEEQPVVQEICEPVDDCIPVTPIMPGSGFCIQPPPWACMPMQGVPYQGVPGFQPAPAMQGYQMMEESSDVWGESPDMHTMGQGYVQGAQQNYPYQASAPVPHHFYGGMAQQYQVAGSHMQEAYESSAESPSFHDYQNFPQQHFTQHAGKKEEDCGCNKGIIGSYGPEVKGQYHANQAGNPYAHHHPDYHQYQAAQPQQMQHQYEEESSESGFMGMGGQQGGQPGMMGGQQGGQPGMMGGQQGGQPWMMGGQQGGQPGMMGGQQGGQPGMMGGQQGGQPWMMGGQQGGQPGMMGGQQGGQPGMMGGQQGGQPWMMGGQQGGQPGMMGGQQGGQPGMMGGQQGGQPWMMGGQQGGQPGMMGGQQGGQPGMMGGQQGGQPGMMGGQQGGQPGMMGG